MENDVKSLKKSFVMAVLGILLFLVSATGVTYAWFSLSGRAHTNVTPMGGTVSRGETVLQIGNSEAGPFDKTCELNINGGVMRPLSTTDLEHFYKVTMQDANGMAMLYENADEYVDRDAVHGTFYLKCLHVPCDVYFNGNDLRLSSDPQALAAMRLGLKITSNSGSKTYIFNLDSLGTEGAGSKKTVPTDNTVVSTVSNKGAATYVADPSESLSAYMAASVQGNDVTAGENFLVSLLVDEVATVEYWIYLEGCDANCINPAQDRDLDIMFAFAAVEAAVSR